MDRAIHSDKKLVIDILTASFEDNKSVNYTVLQGKNRLKRIRYLMGYAFDYCMLFGDVFLTDDKSACALLLKPDAKKATLKSVLLDIKLAVFCIGPFNLAKIIKRETAIKIAHPNVLKNYLWFIGVFPHLQHKGIGSKLLQDVLKFSEQQKRPVFLETSVLQNIPWYRKFGFDTYHQVDFGFTLYFLRKEF